VQRDAAMLPWSQAACGKVQAAKVSVAVLMYSYLLLFVDGLRRGRQRAPPLLLGGVFKDAPEGDGQRQHQEKRDPAADGVPGNPGTLARMSAEGVDPLLSVSLFCMLRFQLADAVRTCPHSHQLKSFRPVLESGFGSGSPRKKYLRHEQCHSSGMNQGVHVLGVCVIEAVPVHSSMQPQQHNYLRGACSKCVAHLTGFTLRDKMWAATTRTQ
jgi:hypothetical protein